jgi:hypothetical protein
MNATAGHEIVGRALWWSHYADVVRPRHVLPHTRVGAARPP